MSDIQKQKKKKSKKSKKTEEVVMDVETEKQKKKKSKKNKKRAIEAAPASEVPVTKKQKKDKKKSKKSKKSKKDKKEKKEKKAEPVAPATSAAAQVHLYKEHPEITAMTAAELKKYREADEIHVKGTRAETKLLTSFTQAALSFPAPVMKMVAGFDKPSPIQAQCWPLMLSGVDVIGIAQTGSGKTLGFYMPAIAHIWNEKKKNPKKNKPTCLVLAPTRELASQINDVAKQASAFMGYRSVCIYGGVPQGEQVRALRSGVETVIATPGRLLGLIEQGNCDLSGVNFVVLDEADRMLDMGFEPAIRRVFSNVSDQRSTMMFSATWPDSVQKVGSAFIRNPAYVRIGDPSGSTTANERVKQTVEVIEGNFAKDKKLLQLMKQYHSSKTNRIIIFVLYKKDVPRVERLLQQKGYKAAGLSSNKAQFQRTQTLAEFKSGVTPLLVATDVAARGLDIPNVEHVINYSFPLTIEDYVHRIGRTGRGGKYGNSYTFFCKDDKNLSGELINLLREAKVDVPESLMKFGTGVKRKQHSMYGAFAKARGGDKPMAAQRRVVL